MTWRDYQDSLIAQGVSPDDESEPLEWRPAEPDDAPRKGEGEVIPFADEWVEDEDD